MARICINQFRKFTGFIFSIMVTRKVKSFTEPLRVNRYSNVTRNTSLGKNVNFNGMAIKGLGKVVIGDNFHSGEGCLILTDNHDYDNGDAIPYGKKSISKDVSIADNVWLGDRVIILPGVVIEEGAIIQAGSVVVSNIPALAIAGGHPAKVFSERNAEHYARLKAEGKFH